MGLQAKLIALLVILLLFAGLIAAYEYEKGKAEQQAALAREAQRVAAQQQEVIRAKERNTQAVKKKAQASQTVQSASDIVEQTIDDLPRPGIILEGDYAKVARSLIVLFNCNGRGMQQNKRICEQSSGAGVLPGAASSDTSPVSLDQFFDEVRKGFTYAIEVENEAMCYVDSQKK